MASPESKVIYNGRKKHESLNDWPNDLEVAEEVVDISLGKQGNKESRSILNERNLQTLS